MVRKEWVMAGSGENRKQTAAAAQRFAAAADLPVIPVLLAMQRGVPEEEIPAYLGAEEPLYTNPFDFPDMEIAAERISRAIDEGERIAIYGDYDCDGVCATAILTSYLKEQGAVVLPYIPDRHTEGYGMNMGAVDKLHAMGVQLIVTVDNGISAHREIEHANCLGMEVVVTDHHQPGDALPPAVCVVNPHRRDCDLEFKDYAGCGVAFYLICAVADTDPEDLLPRYADIIALATIADVVPLKGENRCFVREGLQQMTSNPCLGIAALRRAAQVKAGPIGGMTVGFSLAPRINAAGRMEGAENALRLLLTDSVAEAESIASTLSAFNNDRQRTEDEIHKAAAAWLEEHPEHQYDDVLVFAGEDWHEGVIGIVASRILERYGRPVILLSVSGSIARGSGRSLPGFNLFDALSDCKELFTKYGGHECAAGLTMAAADIDILRRRLNTYAAGRKMPFLQQPIDMSIKPAGLTVELVEALTALEPYGEGNPAPKFAIRGVRFLGAAPLKQGKHSKLTLETVAGERFTALKFGMGPEVLGLCIGDMVDLACELSVNEFQGNRSVSIQIRCYKFARLPNDVLLEALRLAERVRRRDPHLTREQKNDLCPAREDVAYVYRFLSANKGRVLPAERIFLTKTDAWLTETNAFAWGKLLAAVMALCELGLAVETPEGFALSDTQNKVDLTSAPVLRFLQ
ncbi:MAG: single-stranded-DNA-specific exonuclease RecJ [Oscillospiraceae bacterium]|jgi:single-stranded-DNA-specific exonuclease|nr:single-stranded-DNA-specific exonuclease RecJ [Oscillospiraceae bacterium]